MLLPVYVEAELIQLAQVPEALINVAGRTLESQGLRWAPILTAESTSTQTLTPGMSRPPEQVAGTDVTRRALELLAEELAVDIGLLRDGRQVADLGLDSLVSLVMSTRFREELGVEIRDAFFLEISTIGDLKKMLQ